MLAESEKVRSAGNRLEDHECRDEAGDPTESAVRIDAAEDCGKDGDEQIGLSDIGAG